MRRYRAAAVLMILHGGVIELGTFVALISLLLLGVDQEQASDHFSFILPFLQENLYLMMAMSGIFGAVRVVGAVALWKNRMWGLALSVINCVITMALMIFLLPAGLVDGLLAGSALVLILTAYFGGRPAIPTVRH